MSKPLITEVVGGYSLQWEEEKISIDVSRIRSHSDGSVKAEIIVQTSADGLHPHLHQTMFNLLADRSRSELAKTLKSKYSKADWPVILEQLCVNVLKRLRTGEEMEELITGEDVARPEYLLYPLLVRHLPTIIFGDRSTAKSLTAMIGVTVLLLPWKDNPLYWKPTEESITTLWLDWETDRETVLWQLTRLQNGLKMPALSVIYRRMYQPLSQDIDQVQKYLTESKASLIVIDSITLASGGDVKESGPAIALLQAIRRLRTHKGESVTSLLLAHTSKDHESKKKTVVGSFAFEALARVVWESRKHEEEDSDEIEVAMFNRKPPPFDKTHKPIGYKAIFTEDSINIQYHNPKNSDSFSSAMSIQDQIGQVLKNGAMSIPELADAIGAKEASVKVKLYQYRGKRFTQTEGGKWGLLYG